MTPEVLADEPQADGNRHVRFRFTHSSGITVDRRYTLPSGEDALAYAAGRAPRIEAGEKSAELRRAIGQAGSGIDPTTIALKLNTQTELLTFLVKRLANASAETALGYASSFHLLTDAQVAALLGEPEAEVTAWRAKLLALKAAKDDYGHNFPRYEV